jgi:uncharacterized oxidoreductase
MQLSNNKILITGGATGIGLGLTRQFLKEGNQVIICGRRKEILEEVKSTFPALIIYTCDLEQEKDRISLFEWIKKEHPDTNVLVNNAGIQQWTNLDEDDFYEKMKKEISINIEAPLHLSHLFAKLPAIKTIMNVSSGLAFSPLVKVPVYSATKAFLHSFTLSMRKLLQPKNIEVIEIVPPALNTDLGGKGLHDEFPPVSVFIDSIFAQLREGKTTLTFGMSENISNAPPEALKGIFERMNP